MFRLLIQKVLLNELPRAVFTQLLPQYASYTDNQLLKIVRSGFVGVLFGVAHVPGCSVRHKKYFHLMCPEIGLPQSLAGVLLGEIVENSSQTLEGMGRAIFYHFIHNFICSIQK